MEHDKATIAHTIALAVMKEQRSVYGMIAEHLPDSIAQQVAATVTMRELFQ